MRLVIKFGGVPVKDGKSFRKAAGLVVGRYKKRDKLVVVTSAMAGVTDELATIASKLVEPRAKPKQLIPEFMKRISDKHFEVCRGAIADKDILYRTTRTVRGTFDNLQRVLTGISYLGELSPRSQDLVLSFGERLSAPILAGAIGSLGVPSKNLTGFEAGIVTDDQHTEARPLLEKTRKLVHRRLNKILAAGKFL